MKINAKEYLKEFAKSQPDWLKFLIYEVIESNGNISDDKKLEVYSNLTNGTALIINEPNINDSNSSEEIRIISLQHNKGVNALKESQTIKFQNDVTVLYGLNGAGKSSYFKVLNEIVGGNQKKRVSSNIYLDTPTTIDVNISFKEKNKAIQTINWNGNTRSIDILNKCKVFDSSYLNGLLETRKADSTLIQPLGLNLFSGLVVLIDNFKRKLNDSADKKRQEKPTLELKYFQNEIKTSFENSQISNSIKTQIENSFDFTAESNENLTKVKKEIEDLRQINIQDKIKLKQSDKTDIESIKTYLENTHKKLSEFSSNIKSELESLTKHKEANKLAKKQFEILSTIPNSDNSEWKDFIKSGEKYTTKVDDSDKVCIYCRQSLRDENATGLIRAYGDFLKDESEQKVNNSIKSINQIKKNVEALSIELKIKKNIQEILEKNKIEGDNKMFYSAIVNTNAQFTLEKEVLIKQIESENFKPENDLFILEVITNKLNSISASIKDEIDTLSDDNTKKATKIGKLDISLKKLQENESISKQKENIEKWFEADALENKIRKKASKINTRSITDLSKQAHSQLLTEALKESFKEELSFLGYKNLKVKIENAQGGKGTSSTKLMLSKSNDIKAILSEGEQKAVVLALFIAEAKIQKSKNPIILDDPVNSLDHRIAGKFAQRLLKLDNQVILFNHNRLFLDAFETSKENHICKTIDSDCNKSKGKHIRIYQVNSEGQNIKGVLRNYKSNKAKEHLSEVKRLLQNSPFEEELKTASLLRKTVECVIDEVIFNNQLPTKYSNKNSRIAWTELKKLKNDNETIDKLENIHSRASGGEMHNGTENIENPIELEEFTIMVSTIENIMN